MDKSDKLKKNSQEYFDSVANSDYTIPEPTRCYSVVMERLQDRTDLESIADVGCGTGDMLEMIAAKFGEEIKLYGLDLSGNALKQAEEKLAGRAEFIQGDVENLPMEDQKVQIVLNMHSFHHYPNPDKALAEIYRIIAKGGEYWLVENEYKPFRRFIANLRLTLNRHKEGDVKMYAREELLTMIKNAGFTVESAEAIADHSNLIICRK